MNFERGSGILMHITSLPGGFGVGDLGKTAFKFIDFLKEAGQRYWQILPTTPSSAEFDNSPYMCLSAFAGNPLLIDPLQLVDEGLLSGNDLLDAGRQFSDYLVEFDNVSSCKYLILSKAYNAFKESGETTAFDTFCCQEKWLDDYCLFMALREENLKHPWNKWPPELAGRDKKSLSSSRARLKETIGFHKFVQFCFAVQWARLKEYAARQEIFLIGDIPIYVSWNSADVWAHQDCFRLDDRTFQPTHVAGVPPDYFSDTGQLWGNPIYRWQDRRGRLNGALFSWWRDRLQSLFNLVHIARIDHFRGFEAYWEVAAHESTAMNGRWVKGPGKQFFDKIGKELGELPIIAEDLGVITPEVEKLRDDFGYPGMKILQFAFDSDENNPYLLHNYKTTNSVVYTGTHDNDTTLGWYLSDRVASVSKKRAERYGNCTGTKEIHWDFIRMAFSSVADIAIVPMQDVLGFGSDCRMNIPGTAKGNWRWRCAPEFIDNEVTRRLRDETFFYGRGK